MKIEAKINNPGVFTLHELRENGKRLTVKINYRRRIAATRIENVEDEQSKPGTTTALYREARDVIQSAANSSRGPIHYAFITKVPSMKRWAHDPTKGDGIFHWEEIDPPDNNDLLIAVKVFRPSIER